MMLGALLRFVAPAPAPLSTIPGFLLRWRLLGLRLTTLPVGLTTMLPTGTALWFATIGALLFATIGALLFASPPALLAGL